jgi:hypothetical protein
VRSRSLLPASFSFISGGVGGVVEVGGRVIGNYFEHRMGTYAAALAYRGLFALFPFMLLLVVLVGVFGPPNAVDRIVAEVKAQSPEQVPQQLEPMVEQGREQIQPLEEMARRAQRRAEGGLLLFGVAVALWSVSALSSTLADAFNNAYGLTERRPWWKVDRRGEGPGRMGGMRDRVVLHPLGRVPHKHRVRGPRDPVRGGGLRPQGPQVRGRDDRDLRGLARVRARGGPGIHTKHRAHGSKVQEPVAVCRQKADACCCRG